MSYPDCFGCYQTCVTPSTCDYGRSCYASWLAGPHDAAQADSFLKQYLYTHPVPPCLGEYDSCRYRFRCVDSTQCYLTFHGIGIENMQKQIQTCCCDQVMEDPVIDNIPSGTWFKIKEIDKIWNGDEK